MRGVRAQGTTREYRCCGDGIVLRHTTELNLLWVGNITDRGSLSRNAGVATDPIRAVPFHSTGSGHFASLFLLRIGKISLQIKSGNQKSKLGKTSLWCSPAPGILASSADISQWCELGQTRTSEQ